jgi:hypothetical protein
MAVVLGTNSGFCEVSPVDDPAGSLNVMDNRARVIKDTSPATAVRITEIGWWCDTASEEGNFEVALYEDVTGAPDNIISVDRTNAKGTDAGWKKVAVNWSISGSTAYWLGIQLDNVATATNANFTNLAGNGAWKTTTTTTTLPDPWTDFAEGSTAAFEIYVVWDTGPPPATGTKQWLNIDDSWRQLSEAWVNVDDSWRKVKEAWVNVDDVWRKLYSI